MAHALPTVPKGLAYAEALVAMSVLALALTPALEALTNATHNSTITADVVQRDLALRSKLDEVLSLPYKTLSDETYLPDGNTSSSISAALSDPVGSDRRTVTIYRSDGSNVSTNDTGLLRIRVQWEGQASGLESIRSRWL